MVLLTSHSVAVSLLGLAVSVEAATLCGWPITLRTACAHRRVQVLAEFSATQGINNTLPSPIRSLLHVQALGSVFMTIANALVYYINCYSASFEGPPASV